MNPLDLLDGLVPAKYRKTVHLLLLLAAALFSIWMAADGDWRKFAVGVAGAIYTASNAANTSGD